MATITRADLSAAVYEEVGLSRLELEKFVEAVIDEICEQLLTGEKVIITGFGTFMVRDKRARMGRNPRTGEAAPISARRVVTFRPSRILRRRIDARRSGGGDDV